MDLIVFLALSVLNLGLIFLVIWKWSLFSAEGLCLAYLGSLILTDNLALLFHSLASPGALPLGYQEFALRIYPTEVHIVGLLALIATLLLYNPRPRPVARQLNAADILRLRNLGIAIAALGLALVAIAIYLVGALSRPDFYVALSSFRTSLLPFGGFWYRGADIAVFGMALTLPSMRQKMGRFFLVLTLMMFVSFFLRTNKGGLEQPILWGAFVLYVYDRAFFQSLLKLRLVFLACAIAFAGMGLKLWFLPSVMREIDQPPKTAENLLQMATATVGTRWGDNSLYRGYCQFLHTWPAYHDIFKGYRVGVYSLTSWVPRLLYPNKPPPPFLAIGYMTQENFREEPVTDNASPLLVAAAFADGGFLTLAGYLFLCGLFLSVLRRFATARRGSLYRHVGYVIFVLFGGFSAEAGTLVFIYTLLLAYGVVGAAYAGTLAYSFVPLRFTHRAPIENAPLSAARG